MPKKSILIVDDDPDMVEFLSDSLEPEYHVESALSGKEGLKKVLKLRPDLVVVDIMMPEMSGDELLQSIRRLPELNDTLVLIITAKVNDGLKKRLLNEGAQGYLAKPFSVEEFLDQVKKMIF